jgi:nucleotide-binding universal stress UspA family protein
MTYSTLMVHLGIGHPNQAVLKAAAVFAERFEAHVVGILACQPFQMIYGDGFVAGDIIELDREQVETQIKAAEDEFRGAMRHLEKPVEWRSSVTFGALSDYLAREARCADLFLTGVERPGTLFEPSHDVNLGDLVMQIGRPVLVVPATADSFKFERVVVGWKDTRETRRAVADALPLLKKATSVAIVEIAAEKDIAAARSNVEDVSRWLKRHDVLAEAIASVSTGDDSINLETIASQQRADIVVAGAYGHNRLREWVLGGVTRDVLLRPTRCSLVSH